MSLHWAIKYIGLKHEVNGRGPDTVDCWGLLRLIYCNEFGIHLPSHPGITVEPVSKIVHTTKQGLSEDWQEIDQPFDGCGVGMSIRDQIHHVGVYAQADGGKVIHCNEMGVVADTFRQLKLRGYRTIKFYRHIEWHPTS